MVAFASYLLSKDNTLFARVFLAVSIFYFVVSFLGIFSREVGFLMEIWFVLTILLVLFQAAMFFMFAIWPQTSIRHVREMEGTHQDTIAEGGEKKPVHESWRATTAIQHNLLATQILLALGAVSMLVALIFFCAGFRRRNAVVSPFSIQQGNASPYV